MKESGHNSLTEKEVKVEWEELEGLLHRLAKEQQPGRLHLLSEIFKAAVKLAKDNPGTLNLKITATTLKELRYSFKMFYEHRRLPKITMFGSARVPANTPLYAFAKRFAEEAGRRNFMIITGGGPGIMAAGNEGAKDKQGFGLNIRLPSEQSPNPFIEKNQMLIHYKYFFTRKLFLVKEATAFAFFPGGFGTFDEAFEVLTLLQTGKSTLIPVVLLEPKGYGFWRGLEKFMKKELLERGFISEADKHLYHIFHNVKAALDHIELFYHNYHSMRYVKNLLVIRIHKPLAANVMTKMNQEFKDLAQEEKIVQRGELPEESNEPELKDLSRLVLPFGRSDFGRLRLLVDFINKNTV